MSSAGRLLLGSTDKPTPELINPTTGEMMTPDDIVKYVMLIADELMSSDSELIDAQMQLSRITARYGDIFDDAAQMSTARASNDREREGRIATKKITWEPTGKTLWDAKHEAEGRVKALRDHQHNMRSLLSAYQTAARTLGIVINV